MINDHRLSAVHTRTALPYCITNTPQPPPLNHENSTSHSIDKNRVTVTTYNFHHSYITPGATPFFFLPLASQFDRDMLVTMFGDADGESESAQLLETGNEFLARLNVCNANLRGNNESANFEPSSPWQLS